MMRIVMEPSLYPTRINTNLVTNFLYLRQFELGLGTNTPTEMKSNRHRGSIDERGERRKLEDETPTDSRGW